MAGADPEVDEGGAEKGGRDEGCEGAGVVVREEGGEDAARDVRGQHCEEEAGRVVWGRVEGEGRCGVGGYLEWLAVVGGERRRRLT